MSPPLQHGRASAAQLWGQLLVQKFDHLGAAVACAEVHQKDGFILKPVGVLCQVIDVRVPMLLQAEWGTASGSTDGQGGQPAVQVARACGWCMYQGKYPLMSKHAPR